MCIRDRGCYFPHYQQLTDAQFVAIVAKSDSVTKTVKEQLTTFVHEFKSTVFATDKSKQYETQPAENPYRKTLMTNILRIA